MTPPISIDGTDITGATIDGQDVQEITVDGDTVFTAAPDVPDEEDLQVRYDATEIAATDGDSVSSWADESGNGLDLSQSNSAEQPTFKESVINGQPVVRFDTADEMDSGPFGSPISQPNTIFAVFQFRSTTSGDQYMLDSDDGNNRHGFLEANSSWGMFAGGSVVTAGTSDTNTHIFTGLYDGSSSNLRIDGTDLSIGNPGTSAMDGVTLGDIPQGGFGGSVDIGEVLIYPQDKSGIYADVEQYLSDKWGVTL